MVVPIESLVMKTIIADPTPSVESLKLNTLRSVRFLIFLLIYNLQI